MTAPDVYLPIITFLTGLLVAVTSLLGKMLLSRIDAQTDALRLHIEDAGDVHREMHTTLSEQGQRIARIEGGNRRAAGLDD